MQERRYLTLTDVLIKLRQDLLDARQSKKVDNLECLFYVFALIEDLALEKGDGPTSGLALDMYDAVRDTYQGVEWKSSIPSVDEIEANFSGL